MKRLFMSGLVSLLLCWLMPSAWGATAADWVATKQARVRLVAAPGGTPDAVRLGIEFDLAPGWKTYWRAPGDAGYAATVDWKGSADIVPGALQWPAPERFSVSGLETFGYEGRLVLPVSATRPDPARPGHVAAAVDFLACAVLCVPNHASLSLDLAPGPVAADNVALLDHWQARVPPVFRNDLAILSVAAGGAGRSAFLDIMIGAAPPLAAPDVMIEGDGATVTGLPRVMPQSTVSTVLRLGDPADKDGALAKLAGKRLTITVLDRATLARADAPPRALTAVDVPVLHATSAGMPGGGGVPATVLVLALLGGLILNVMPCVLPVLSLKILALAGLSAADIRHRRLSFLAGAAGIIASFLVLGGVLAAAKAGGAAIGWGVQFQYPIFLAALVAVLTAFAGNLLGFFEIAQPCIGGQAMSKGSLAGHFATGVLATVLATPCSAPFLGTAVGFALAADSQSIMAIFFCLGVGFALPQLLIAVHPGLGRLLPRPGRWMLVLRRVLGLLLIGTALWLGDVIAGQAGAVAAIAVLVLAAVALGLLAGLRRFGRSAGLAAFVVLIAVVLVPDRLAAPVAAAMPAAGWQAYDPSAIAGDVADGKTVLVDVTARWCLTCQVNERLVLARDPVRPRLAAPGVVAMRADWTRPDAAIEALLHDYGRFGIPFAIVYGPRAPQGIVLPEVLSADAVLGALAQAGAS